jgi:hypothetical protein
VHEHNFISPDCSYKLQSAKPVRNCTATSLLLHMDSRLKLSTAYSYYGGLPKSCYYCKLIQLLALLCLTDQKQVTEISWQERTDCRDESLLHIIHPKHPSILAIITVQKQQMQFEFDEATIHPWFLLDYIYLHSKLGFRPVRRTSSSPLSYINHCILSLSFVNYHYYHKFTVSVSIPMISKKTHALSNEPNHRVTVQQNQLQDLRSTTSKLTHGS